MSTPTATPRTERHRNCANPYRPEEEVAWDFARTLETELARLLAENEQLKADVSREITVCDTACMEAQRLRAEVERLLEENVKLNGYADMHMKEKARAERAEAALAEDKARLDWLLENAHDPYVPMVSDRAAIDAAMKASEV